MPFQRIPSSRWAQEVPGTRWHKADLHLHTLDDHPGGRAERPAWLNGDATDPEVLRAYARHFLQSAIARRVEVLGLTPHDVRTGPQTSAVWTIVEVWASEEDDDGTPFRDKIRAVFPGFEPSLNVGRRGVHLIFLFDPEIGRDRFLRLFDTLMGGVPPWENGQLRISGLDAVAAFEQLDDMHLRDNAPPDNADRWDYLVLAPHAFSGSGLLNGVQAQVLQQFPSDRLSAIELSDNQTPEQATANRPWLRPAMRQLRHAFYHSSDAYGFDPDPAGEALFKVGSRCTLLKLSSPRIEALRQAFLAEESRLRLMYHHDAVGQFVLRSDLPEPCPAGPGARPWLRELKLTGGTSFLRGQTFRLSPDLTCIIGGSMTGKSTLLDGLRLTMLGDAGLPAHGSAVRKTVEDRARNRFLSGNPQVELESPAGDLARPVPQRFGMQFFSQGELKDMAENAEAIEHLLFHLVPGRADVLLAQRDQLRELDERLSRGARTLTDLQERVAEAEQLFQRAEQAREALERFAQAGTTELPPAQKDVARTREFARAASDRLSEARALVEALGLLNAPAIQAADIAASLTADPAVDTLLAQARQHAANAGAVLEQVSLRASQLETAAATRHQQLVAQVQQALVAAGGSAEDLNAFDAYSKAAQNYDSYKAALDGKVTEQNQAQASFTAAWQEREQLVAGHRALILEVCQEVGTHYEQRVRIVVDQEGRRDGLKAWVDGLRQRGIGRWWNAGANASLKASALRPVLQAIDDGRTADANVAAQALGMTPAVSDTLLEALAPWGRRLEVWALRCPDRYRLQWVEGGVAKDLDQLSGGRKVAVLLALLLESDDTTPLVVDQPEDELDNRFLNETIIPALHRLKGKRQVIFATHNANIVVNGDADRVIALEADAHYGRVYAEGAIEDPTMREAILKTLDGGKEAFRLRRAKYGF